MYLQTLFAPPTSVTLLLHDFVLLCADLVKAWNTVSACLEAAVAETFFMTYDYEASCHGPGSCSIQTCIASQSIKVSKLSSLGAAAYGLAFTDLHYLFDQRQHVLIVLHIAAIATNKRHCTCSSSTTTW